MQDPNHAQKIRYGHWLAVMLGGAAVGLVVGGASWQMGLVLVVGAFATVLPVYKPAWALYALFFGLAMTSDSVSGFPKTFFAIPDPDLFQGLPPLLTSYLLWIFVVLLVKDFLLERNPLALRLKPLGLFALLLLFAAVAGLLRGNDPVMIRVDFMNFLFPVLCFYLCVQVLQTEAHIRHLLAVLVAAALVKSLILLAFYLSGRGWPYDNNPETGFLIATMDSADLLVFITLLLAGISLWAHRRVRPGAAWLLALGALPLLLVVLFAYRRAQWVGLAASFGLLFWWAQAVAKKRLAVLSLCLLVLGAGVVMAVGGGHEKLARIAQRTLSILDKKQDSNVYHLLESQQTLKDIAPTPMRGLGLGGRHSPLGLYEEDEVPTNIVHNTWLYIWMKMGLPGLLFFIWASVAYLRRLVRSGQLANNPLLLAMASSFGLWMAMFVTGPVPWYFHQTYFIALFAAMAVVLSRKESPPESAADAS